MDKSPLPSPPPSDDTFDTLLTKEQVAEQLGMKVLTLNRYIQQKRLVPVPSVVVPASMRKGKGKGSGGRAYFTPAAVARLQAEIAANKAERAANQIIVDGKKRCSKCKEPKPLSRFSPTHLNDNGLQSICLDCMGQMTRDWEKRNPEQRRKSKRAWAKANPPDEAAKAAQAVYKKAYYEANKARILEKNRAARAKAAAEAAPAKEPADA